MHRVDTRGIFDMWRYIEARIVRGHCIYVRIPRVFPVTIIRKDCVANANNRRNVGIVLFINSKKNTAISNIFLKFHNSLSS